MAKKKMPSVATNQHSVTFSVMYVVKAINARPASRPEKGIRPAHTSIACLFFKNVFDKWTIVDEPRTKNASHFVNVYMNYLYELQLLQKIVNETTFSGNRPWC